MTSQKQPKPSHGGKRTPGEGKKLGPPFRERKLRIIKIQCTEAELAQILSQIPDTRERAEALLKVSTGPTPAK